MILARRHPQISRFLLAFRDWQNGQPFSLRVCLSRSQGASFPAFASAAQKKASLMARAKYTYSMSIFHFLTRLQIG